jgi:hypothetical protein
MENDDEQFEKYLEEFQPRRPRALPDQAVPRIIWRRRLAVAAVVAIALGVSVWSARQRPASQEPLEVGHDRPARDEKQSEAPALSRMALTRLAVENSLGLDAALEVAQKNALPRFDRENSVLRILARE